MRQIEIETLEAIKSAARKYLREDQAQTFAEAIRKNNEVILELGNKKLENEKRKTDVDSTSQLILEELREIKELLRDRIMVVHTYPTTITQPIEPWYQKVTCTDDEKR